MKKYILLLICAMAALLATGCADEERGQSVGTYPAPDPSEYYSGGELGTAFNTTSVAFEQPTVPVENDAALSRRFLGGEALFEKPFMTNATGVRRGLGPLYIRTSCIHCHPGYGHGKRQTTFDTGTIGNGYLLVLTDDRDAYLGSLTGMPQTRAVEPFKAPIDESKIEIAWHDYTDEWSNRFPDGESYSLVYPEVTISEDAYYVPLLKGDGKTPVAHADVRVRLESTIGIYGTGLLDAIADEELKAQYAKEEADGYVELNPAFFKNGEWVKQYSNSRPSDGGTGEQHPFRFTYALSRGPLQDAAGSNAIWNITNVTRSNRRYHYMTAAYVERAVADPDVRAGFAAHIAAYCPGFELTANPTEAQLTADIERYLTGKDAQGAAILPVEMSDADYTDLMIWHRGLAVPAARNLDDDEVRRGKALFTEMGCAYCHRPAWTTGADDYTDPSGFFTAGNELPRYPNQKIWPYTDLVQHRLYMQNDIRTGWCRTTPLWGRGLHRKCTGSAESDRLHDCRARTVVEAIMWHGAAASDARRSVEKFRALSKSDREAVVKFIDAI